MIQPPVRTIASTHGTHGTHGQRGFTLIELMISLVISSILVVMILTVFFQMSAAYRSQAGIATLQQSVEAAKRMVDNELRNGGMFTANGFTIASQPGPATADPPVPVVQAPIQLFDGIAGTTPTPFSDQIRVFYGDPVRQAQVALFQKAGVPVTAATYPADQTAQTNIVFDQVVVDSAAQFVGVAGSGTGDDLALIVASKTEPGPQGSSAAAIPKFVACVMKISGVNGNIISFATAAGSAFTGSTRHCHLVIGTHLQGNPAAADPNDRPFTMIYAFKAWGLRVNYTAPSSATNDGVNSLQTNVFGGYRGNPGDDDTSNWTDLAVGFTNMQISARVFFNGTGTIERPVDTDTGIFADGDPTRNWVRDAAGLQGPSLPPAYSPTNPAIYVSSSTDGWRTITQLHVTLVARSDNKVQGVTTSTTPNLNDLDIGNLPAQPLPALEVGRTFRVATSSIDLRNLGVGR